MLRTRAELWPVDGGSVSKCENQELQRLIVRYLSAHPLAADSWKGICDWWIPMQRLSETEENVTAALTALVESGDIVAERAATGAILYRARARLQNPPIQLSTSQPQSGKPASVSKDLES